MIDHKFVYCTVNKIDDFVNIQKSDQHSNQKSIE